MEERYREDGMPAEVISQLAAWGHRVDVLYPGSTLLPLAETVRAGSHDAWVLKTVSGGPGLSLLESAAVVGLVTVNDVRSVRGVRDKAVAGVVGRVGGLPVPRTYSVAHPGLLVGVPEGEFPLVVKPAEGSSGRAVRLVRSPGEVAGVAGELAGEGLLIAQPYVPNSGADLKVYCVGGELFATERASPLHPGRGVAERRVGVPSEVAGLVLRAGSVYGLDLFGVDVVFGPDGPVIVDVNDFPSFRQVPDAAARVAGAVVDLARGGGGGVSSACSRAEDVPSASVSSQFWERVRASSQVPAATGEGG